MTRARIALVAVAYGALIAHLLFIPYAFSPLPLDEALRQFAQIPWLELGSDQNVALASRGLMFAPLGLLLAACVAPQPCRRIEIPALIVAGLLGGLWAIGVNLAQLWFPSRTVSLNNLVAEFCGVIGGGLLWSTLGATALRWRQQLAAGGRSGLRAALSGYVLVYLFASLAPFDFVTRAGEISQKAASDLYGLWLAPVGCGPAPCGMKFASALLAAIPCGWWFVSRRRKAGNVWLTAVPFALLVSTTIELLHFLMVSGVSQGASVVMRASGMVLGVVVYPWRDRLTTLDIRRFGRPAVVALLLPYLVAIAYVAGWFRSPKLGFAKGLARLNEVVWLPFFYQYYSAYQSTMYSALVHAVLYAPVGLACWLWVRREQVGLWPAALLAALLALAAETSKVLLAWRLPDYTDILIAAASAAVALEVLNLVSRVPRPPEALHASPASGATAQPSEVARPEQLSMPAPAQAGARVAGALLLAIAALTVIDFPVGSWALALGLVVYGAVLVRFPTAVYLIAIPALLPVLDLAPLSGRFFWDEFDALLATTLGVRLLMKLPMRQEDAPLPKVALWLLFLSIVASTAISVWPPAPVDVNAFSSYLSTYNGLRIARAYVWAGVVLWLVCRDASAGQSIIPWLRLGLALGLLAATLSVFWERVEFTGSLGLSAAFRAAGFVSATHVGGAYLEAILVMLAPFGLAQALAAERTLPRSIWYVVVALGAGAVLMTLSRTAFVAWLIAVAAFTLVWSWKRRARPTRLLTPGPRWGSGIAVLALLAATVLAARSTYLPERMATTDPDFSIRTRHWHETIDLMRRDPLHLVLGMGLGSFPREFYLVQVGTRQLPAYRLERDPDSRLSYLVLTGGHGMYMDQRVAAKVDSELRLRGQVRSPRAGAKLSVGLCQKSFLNSVACDEAVVSAGPTWQSFELKLLSHRQRDARFAPTAPMVLSLHNGLFGARVEVTRLSLADDQVELLANGSFEQGLDRWFVTSDEHLAWRTKSTPLQIAFEQGLVGVLAWLALSAWAIAVIRKPSASPGVTAAFAAALIGFVGVASFDSLLDSPRLILLVTLIGVAGLGSQSAPRRT